MNVDYRTLKIVHLLVRALKHRLRRRLIEVISEDGPMTVTDIYIKMRMEQSVASQHLGILRKAGIIHAERQGKHIYYTVNKNELERVSKLIDSIANHTAVESAESVV